MNGVLAFWQMPNPGFLIFYLQIIIFVVLGQCFRSLKKLIGVLEITTVLSA